DNRATRLGRAPAPSPRSPRPPPPRPPRPTSAPWPRCSPASPAPTTWSGPASSAGSTSTPSSSSGPPSPAPDPGRPSSTRAASGEGLPEEHLGDLDGVEGGALAEVVGHRPEQHRPWVGQVAADAADEHPVGPGAF